MNAKIPTNFLLLGSLKKSSSSSWFGKSFAFGITLDKRVNTFITPSDGNTSSAILPEKEDRQVMFYPTIKKIQPRLEGAETKYNFLFRLNKNF